MKIRIKYAKTGVLRYIGHLDVMRYFQKAIRRAGLDVAYSQGYSPHQLITFAAPLGLGVTSEGEYFDAEMNSLTSSEDMVTRLNATMAPGMEVKDIVQLKEGAKTAMAVVAASDYLITCREGYGDIPDFTDALDAFYSQERIEVVKVSKTKETQMDIKSFIYKLEAGENGIYMLLSTGSVDNIKPELVMEGFCHYLNRDYQKLAFRVHRLETYMRNEAGELVSLLEAGVHFHES
ncbi:radical SAM-linked protein [Clostridium sp. CAG:632]|nr:radical SAM-linked protein [Clostridium sp. CAG:632]